VRHEGNEIILVQSREDICWTIHLHNDGENEEDVDHGAEKVIDDLWYEVLLVENKCIDTNRFLRGIRQRLQATSSSNEE